MPVRIYTHRKHRIVVTTTETRISTLNRWKSFEAQFSVTSAGYALIFATQDVAGAFDTVEHACANAREVARQLIDGHMPGRTSRAARSDPPASAQDAESESDALRHG